MLVERRKQPMEPKYSFDELLEIIKDGPQNLPFKGASEEEIGEVEKTLGRKLPPSFRKFLKFANGAVLYQTEKIFGTKDTEDGLQRSILSIKKAIEGLPDQLVPFYKSRAICYFDFNQPFTENDAEHEGEYKIVGWNNKDATIIPISNSFPQWLRERIIEEFDYLP